MTRLLLIAAILFSGCAYGYAGKEAKRRSEREYKPTVRVITVKEEPEEPKEKPKPVEPDPNASPCGRPTFDIYFYSASRQAKKTVDCARRAVVDVKEGEFDGTTQAEARAANLPEGSWYLLVDPKGARPAYLNNAQLLRLSREFSIEYYGRDVRRDLLVYLYQQEDVQ